MDKVRHFIDPRFLTFDDADAGVDAGLLGDFFSEGVLRRCNMVPVVDFKTTSHRLAVVRTHIARNAKACALRLGHRDLKALSSGTQIADTLASLGRPTQETVLILDLAHLDLVSAEAFAGLVASLLATAQGKGPWLRVVVEATHYPEKNPAPANGAVEVPRTEWLAWARLSKLHPWATNLATFGDYGADNANIRFGSGGGSVQIHLRYATPETWFICRVGAQTETSDGTIAFAAKQIVDSGKFAGEIFSSGDEDIARIAEKLGSSGWATDWRRMNMNHHMTRATVDLGLLVGEPLTIAIRRRRAVQTELFPLGR